MGRSGSENSRRVHLSVVCPNRSLPHHLLVTESVPFEAYCGAFDMFRAL
jgi:hypothetical protein